MGENNNNSTNNNNNSGNQAQNSQNNSQQQNQNNQNNQNAQNTQQNNSVDVSKVKADAQAEFLKSLGYDDADSLKSVLEDHKKYVDSQKTDMQKAQDDLAVATKRLAEETEARILAEAKYEALNMGVRPELVSDVVLIAKNRVTKEKDIAKVLSEMKDNENEKVFFVDSSQNDGNNTGNQNNQGGTEGNNVTRRRPGSGNNNNDNKANQANNNSENNGVAGKYAGTMAAKLFAEESRGRKKSSYFSN